MSDAGHSHSSSDAIHSRHSDTHGAIDPSILSNDRGIWAIKWSFVGLFATANFQVVIVLLSGSVALLADTIHNFGDAATAIPLWIAFTLGRRKPSKRFSYGLGRVENLAGVTIVLIIFFERGCSRLRIHRSVFSSPKSRIFVGRHCYLHCRLCR